MEYEIDRRYEFVATADSVCPVPDGAIVCVWIKDRSTIMEGKADSADWRKVGDSTITHFMVTEYPPEKHTAWVNIYSNCDMRANSSRKYADQHANDERKACIKIEWEEGDGL